MKNFIYLVQGKSDLVRNYFHLAERPETDAVFLTYDKEIENAIFFSGFDMVGGQEQTP